MSVEWKIDDGTTNQTIASWGLKSPALSLSNQAADTLTLGADLDIDEADIFAYDTSVVLYRDSSVWFRGKVTDVPRRGEAAAESHSYVVSGPWHDLDRLPFEQVWIQLDSATVLKTHVVIGKAVAVGVAIKEVLDYAISKGISLSYDTDELDALDTVAPYADLSDVTCGEAVRVLLRWYPDLVTWFDYSPATPLLHFVRRADATAVSFDINSGASISLLDIHPRYDILCTGVIINYERQNTFEQWNAVFTDKYPTSAVSGLTTLTLTVQLGSSGTLDALPSGVAELLYSALSVLQFEGSIDLLTEEVTNDLWLGKVLNLTNGLSVWSAMNALIQKVDFNIEDGSATATFGPPEHLGPTDYIELLNINRSRNAGDGYGPEDESDEEETTTFSGTPYYVKQVNAAGDAEIYDEVHMT